MHRHYCPWCKTDITCNAPACALVGSAPCGAHTKEEMIWPTPVASKTRDELAQFAHPANWFQAEKCRHCDARFVVDWSNGPCVLAHAEDCPVLSARRLLNCGTREQSREEGIAIDRLVLPWYTVIKADVKGQHK